MDTLSIAQKDLDSFTLHELQQIAKYLKLPQVENPDILVRLIAKKLHHKKAQMPNDYAGKRILVTGGAGFIGSNLVDALLKNNAQFVRVLDNLSTGFEKNLQQAKTHSNFEFLKGDIRSLETCKKACRDIDIVFHEAALVSVPKSMQDPILNNDINVNGTLNMLVAASEAKVQRFVYASSAAVYGDDPKVPKKETMPRHYPSPYALSKGVDEDYAKLWAYKTELGNGITCVGLRYFNVYGPRQDPRSPYSGVISIFADRISTNRQIVIFGDGEQTRDFVYVGDVVKANLIAGLATIDQSAIFNVGTGKQITLNNLVETISKILDKNVDPVYGPEREGDIRHSVANISKINNIGYKPETTLYEGLGVLLG